MGFEHSAIAPNKKSLWPSFSLLLSCENVCWKINIVNGKTGLRNTDYVVYQPMHEFRNYIYFFQMKENTTKSMAKIL